MFDIIVPLCNYYKDSFKYRLEAIRHIYNSFFLKQKGLDKILYVEQSLNGEYPYLDKIRHFSMPQYPGPLKAELIGIEHPIFNKQWCINVGARFSKATHIIIADCDIWARDDVFDRTFRMMRLIGCPWAFAWNRMIQTDEKTRRECIEHGRFPVTNKTVIPSRGGFEGGFVAMERKFFFEIGMANEEMEELGGVDNDIAMRAEFQSGQYLKNAAVAVHLWHPRPNTETRRKRKSRIENIRILLAGKQNVKAYIHRLGLLKKKFGNRRCPL